MNDRDRRWKAVSAFDRKNIVVRMLQGERLRPLAKQYALPYEDLKHWRKIFRTHDSVGEPLLNRNEAASLLGMKPATLATWFTKGKGPAVTRIGQMARYKPSDIRKFIRAEQERYNRKHGTRDLNQDL